MSRSKTKELYTNETCLKQTKLLNNNLRYSYALIRDHSLYLKNEFEQKYFIAVFNVRVLNKLIEKKITLTSLPRNVLGSKQIAILEKQFYNGECLDTKKLFDLAGYLNFSVFDLMIETREVRKELKQC